MVFRILAIAAAGCGAVIALGLYGLYQITKDDD